MNIVVNRPDNSCDVAIIGAGPYGLAAAAHLRARDVSVRVFGEAMSFWRHNMPTGMKLRSPWIATHIAEPRGRYRLDDYFGETGAAAPRTIAGREFYRLWNLVPGPRSARSRYSNGGSGGAPRRRLSHRPRRRRECFRQARRHGDRASAITNIGLLNSTACRAAWSATRANIPIPRNSADAASRLSAVARARANRRRCCMRPARMWKSSVAAIWFGTPIRARAAPCAKACALCSEKR